MDFKYDVIVIGAGHAGCEAAGAGRHAIKQPRPQPIWVRRPA